MACLILKNMVTKINDEIRIYIILSDEKGHANWNIAKRLRKKPPNVSKILTKLEAQDNIYRESRPTTNPLSSHPNQPEDPYYLHKNIAVFRYILQKLTKNIDSAPIASDPRNLSKILKGGSVSFNEATYEQLCGLIRDFVKSSYTIKMIEIHGFKSTYLAYKQEVEDNCGLEQFIDHARSMIIEGSIPDLNVLGENFLYDVAKWEKVNEKVIKSFIARNLP
jgi:hypothetical protein